MKAEDREFIREHVEEMMRAHSCSDEAKKAGQKWLDSDGGEEATRELMAELTEQVLPIDDVIAFTDSDAGRKLFGEDKAKEMHRHAKEIKEKGELYCDCPACKPAKAILARRPEFLK